MLVVDIRMRSSSQLGSAHGVRSLATLSSADASRGLPRGSFGGRMRRTISLFWTVEESPIYGIST